MCVRECVVGKGDVRCFEDAARIRDYTTLSESGSRDAESCNQSPTPLYMKGWREGKKEKFEQIEAVTLAKNYRKKKKRKV